MRMNYVIQKPLEKVDSVKFFTVQHEISLKGD
jgi:hypothetical protein